MKIIPATYFDMRLVVEWNAHSKTFTFIRFGKRREYSPTKASRSRMSRALQNHKFRVLKLMRPTVYKFD